MRQLRLVSVYFLMLVLAIPVAAKDRKELIKHIDELLSQPDTARGLWGIEIVNVDTGRTLYSRNADKLFVPASNTKLFTTAAAMALIGPQYVFRTTVETLGTVDRRGRLSGDLVVVGRGDPNLSGRTLPFNMRTERKASPMQYLQQLADQVVARGVRVIDGDIVADDSYYAFERYGDGWSQEDLVSEWGAPVSALSINDNVVFVTVMPADRVGERAFLDISPFADYYRIDNRVITTPQGTGPRRVYVRREPGSNQLTLWGNIPVDDTGGTESLAIDDPAEFTAILFRQLLEQRGVAIYGKTRTHHTELASLSTFSVTAVASAGGGADVAPPPVTLPPLVLAEHSSAPLSEDLQVINKVSQNLHAELLLRLLGREKGTSGSIQGGLEVERAWLTQAEILPDEYVFYDGSGLSRQNLVTPHAIVKLLNYTKRQPWAREFEETLAVGGVDGSLVGRFKDPLVLGRVKAKTGSLGHVNALSGFATTLKGEHVVFSVICNNHLVSGKRATETIDSIVAAVINDLPPIRD